MSYLTMKGGSVLDKIEADYLNTIFEAVPLMSEFEKGRLYGIAQEILRRKAEKEPGTAFDTRALAGGAFTEHRDDDDGLS